MNHLTADSEYILSSLINKHCFLSAKYYEILDQYIEYFCIVMGFMYSSL